MKSLTQLTKSVIFVLSISCYQNTFSLENNTESVILTETLQLAETLLINERLDNLTSRLDCVIARNETFDKVAKKLVIAGCATLAVIVVCAIVYDKVQARKKNKQQKAPADAIDS